jgi:hypothetical protein
MPGNTNKPSPVNVHPRTRRPREAATRHRNLPCGRCPRRHRPRYPHPAAGPNPTVDDRGEVVAGQNRDDPQDFWGTGCDVSAKFIPTRRPLCLIVLSSAGRPTRHRTGSPKIGHYRWNGGSTVARSGLSSTTFLHDPFLSDCLYRFRSPPTFVNPGPYSALTSPPCKRWFGIRVPASALAIQTGDRPEERQLPTANSVKTALRLSPGRCWIDGSPWVFGRVAQADITCRYDYAP